MKSIFTSAKPVGLALIALLTLLIQVPALAQINYQGRLTDATGATLLDGQYSITFSLWTTATDGTQFWGPYVADGGTVGTGHGPLVDVVGGVNPNGGRFNVIIGNLDTIGRSLTTVLAANPGAFLEIKVGTDVAISPRQIILPAPRALTANVIPNVTPGAVGDGVTVSGALKATGGIQVGSATPPVAKLEVTQLTGSTAIQINGTGLGPQSWGMLATQSRTLVINRPGLRLAVFGNDGSAFLGGALDEVGAGAPLTVQPNGRIGINTNNPTRGALEVVGSVGTAVQYGGFLNANGAGSALLNIGSHPVTIYAGGNVVAQEYYAMSDARIKKIQGRSDGAADLAILSAIEITDYTHKDVVSNDSRPHKKVIAQQLETVYPQAVSLSTDVVPDIYQKAAAKDGWVALANDLKVGENVRLIDGKTKAIYEVLEVRDGAFRTAFQPATETIFVYGREVKDFRTVDYEAIAMLNVSATQELNRKLEAKSAEISKLTAGLAESQAGRITLAEKLAALEARLTRLETALSNPVVRTVSTPGRAANSLRSGLQ